MFPGPGPGDLLADRYELGDEIGAGGMGRVFCAFDHVDGREVAVKILSRLDPSSRRRFRREFRAAARLRHPSVVAVYGYYGVEPPFIAMELVVGVPVTSWVAAAAAEAERTRRIRALIRQLLGTLVHVHAHGLVHRDLKPDNLLVTAGGDLKIMDFGLVRGGGSSGGTISQGQIIGTLTYMAPEQLEGRPVDGRADLYSTGAILYELLTGAPLFEATGLGSLALAILDDTPPPPSALRPAVDLAMSAFAMTLLAKRPWQRFASAADALAVLDESQAGGGRPPLLVAQFAGREAELAIAEEALERLAEPAATRRGGLLLVRGEAGTGKSRYLAEVAALARRSRLAVLEGGEAVLSRAVAECSLAARRDADAPGMVVIVDDLGRERARAEALRAVALELACAAGPGEPPLPLLVVGAYGEPIAGSDGIGALTSAVSRCPGGEILRLEPLELAEVSVLVRSMLGVSEAPAALASWVQEQSAGNPLFIEETIRQLVEEGVLHRRGGTAVVRGALSEPVAGSFAGVSVARGLRAVTARRVVRLPESCRRVLTAAAGVGGEFTWDELRQATTADEDELNDDLERLITARFVVELASEPDRYRFVSDPVRDALRADDLKAVVATRASSR